MREKLRDNLIPAGYLIFILFLSFPVINTFIPQKNYLLFGLKDYFITSIIIFLITGFIVAEWEIIVRCFKEAGEKRFFYTAIVLSPIGFLFFWNPQSSYPPIIFPIFIIFLTQFCFWGILSNNNKYSNSFQRQKKKIFIIVGLYILIFVTIAIRQYNYFSNFNPKDFAIYNQTFWNTIHGRVFQNSAYGSNFSCHNSPFFFLLVPFYYLVPHPVTLLVMKTTLLAFSAVPLYLIARKVVDEKAIIPLLMAYLFYPPLISQNFTAPHEISYAPFFILFAYYFYLCRRFWLYIIFLLITLSIKEHIAFIAVMFGFHSLWTRRGMRWVIIPIVLGLIWGLFSLWVINYFQRTYNSHVDAAWFIVDLNRRFLQNKGNFLHSFITTLSASNIGHWYGLQNAFLFFSCVGIFLPFLSSEALLGIPELIIALLSNRPAMLSVPWHYAIIFSCFLFISAVNGIHKVSEWPRLRKFSLSNGTIQALLAIVVFSATLMHIYTWIDLSRTKKTKDYAKSVKEALVNVPSDAFITVPREIAPHVSSRGRYSLLDKNQKEYGDYVLAGRNTPYEQLPKENKSSGYKRLLTKGEIILFKRRVYAVY